jgi:hypothetical protein
VVLAVVPVAEPVGDLTPVDRGVVAFPQVREQVRVEGARPGGEGVLDGTVGVAEDPADGFGPVLPVGVQGVDALEVAG